MVTKDHVVVIQHKGAMKVYGPFERMTALRWRARWKDAHGEKINAQVRKMIGDVHV